MDELQILVSAVLNPDSKQKIKKQLTKIKGKIEMDAEIKNFNKLKAQIESLGMSKEALAGLSQSRALLTEISGLQKQLANYKMGNLTQQIAASNVQFNQMKNHRIAVGKSYKEIDSLGLKNFNNTLKVAESHLKLFDITRQLKDVEKLKRDLATLKPANVGTLKDSVQEIDKLISKMSSLDDKQKSTAQTTKRKLIQAIKDTTNEMKNAISKQNQAVFRQNSENFKAMVDSIIAQNSKLRKHILSNKFQALKTDLVDPKALTNAQRQFNVLKQQANELGLLSRNIFSQVGEKFRKILEYFGVFTTITFAIQKFRQMIQVIYEVDTAMTSLKKVTNGTDLAYKTFFNNAIGLAEKLHGKISDVIQATAEWAKLGYSIQDATKLAELNLLYKNVGDVDVQTGTKDMVSVQKAFKVSTEDMITVLDKYNEVSNNYSISMAGIGEGMRRSSSAMKLAGNDLNDTIALLVAGNNVLQDPAIVGTFLKTASMRIRGAGGLTTEMKNIINTEGLDMEGTLDTITKVQAKIKQLTNNKVDIMLNPDTFKSTYNILKEISDVWDNITDRNKAEIVEIIGGNEPQLALYVQKCA